jgi:phosphoribosylglycinamide formyltransferase-1
LIGIAVLVSGSGSNLQALIDAQKSGLLRHGKIVLVVSSNPSAYALERAERAGIKTSLINPKDWPDKEQYAKQLCGLLEQNDVELVVLAGFLTILPGLITKRYEGRIINVHPSLIPSFCGRGWYGLKVHREALKRGVKVTGATVHLVDDRVDAGKILMQKAIDVLPDDTPETLSQRVLEQCEWVMLPRAVEDLAREIEEEKQNNEQKSPDKRI